MAAPIIVPLTPGIVAADNYTIRITALDPSTGNVVSGVKVSLSTILGTNIADTDTGTDGNPATNTAVLLPGPAI